MVPRSRIERRTVLYLERNVDGTIGGSYRSLLYLIQRLPQDRWQTVTLFHRDHELVAAYRAAGCHVHLVERPASVNLLGGFSAGRRLAPLRVLFTVTQKAINFWKGALPLLIKYLGLLRRERVDLVHLNNGVMSGTELLLAGRLLGIPTVVHQRGIGPLPPAFSAVKQLIDHVICVSEAARQNVIAHGLAPERCTTVHNGIDPDEFRSSIVRDPIEVRRSLGIPDGALVIGNSGMIRRWKGQHVLLQAMARLKDSFPGVYCLLVGGVSDRGTEDRTYLGELETFVRAHGLLDRVVFAGYQRRVADYVQTVDVMVHTAVEPEPFSRSVLEGMTLGRALVATRTGGTPEALEDGVSGLLVPPDNSAAMADAIARLVGSPDLRRRLGEAAARRVAERFSIGANVAATEAVYDRLLHER